LIVDESHVTIPQVRGMILEIAQENKHS